VGGDRGRGRSQDRGRDRDRDREAEAERQRQIGAQTEAETERQRQQRTQLGHMPPPSSGTGDACAGEGSSSDMACLIADPSGAGGVPFACGGAGGADRKTPLRGGADRTAFTCCLLRTGAPSSSSPSVCSVPACPAACVPFSAGDEPPPPRVTFAFNFLSFSCNFLSKASRSRCMHCPSSAEAEGARTLASGDAGEGLMSSAFGVLGVDGVDETNLAL